MSEDASPPQPTEQPPINLPAVPATTTPDLKDMLEDTLMDSIQDIVQGAEADLRIFVSAISANIIAAAAANNMALIDELKGQLGVVLELNRIRTSRAANQIIGAVVSALSKFLVKQLANVDFGDLVDR